MICQFPVTQSDYDATRNVSERVVHKLQREYGESFEWYFPPAQVIELKREKAA